MARSGKNVYYRQSTGKWEGRYVKGRRANGRLRYGYVSGTTEEECTTKRELAVKALEDRFVGAVMGERLLFSVVAAKWLESEERTKKDSTICRYRNNLKNHLNPRFKGMRYMEITKEEVVDMIEDLKEDSEAEEPGLSWSSIKNILTVLRSILEYGESLYHFPAVNLNGIVVGGKGDRKIRVFTRAEEELLVSHLLSGLDGDRLGILLALYTGLRVGELCSLRWGDIDFIEGALTVRSTMKRLQTPEDPVHRSQVVITPPKSRKSIRTVPIHQDILRLLSKYAGGEETFFLTGKEKEYIEPRTMQNRFKAILKKVGIADANFHALRHTFATRSIENGVDAKVLSELLGHTSVEMTLNRYVHPSEEQKRNSINTLPGLQEAVLFCLK